MLVATMNPCPCGNFGTSKCHCNRHDINKYLNRIPGPLLDRIDIHIETPPVEYGEIKSPKSGETSETIRSRVLAAREVQAVRYADAKGMSAPVNARLPAQLIAQYCAVEPMAERLLESAFGGLELSVRAHHKILKLSRTIADLGGGGIITARHVSEAISYRTLDRKYW
jgi:magnesium chelatase family protein